MPEICDCSTFCKLGRGASGRIVSVGSDTPLLCRLREMGLVEGTEIEIVKVAPLGDPVELRFRGQSLCLRRNETASIQVEVLSTPGA